MWRRAFPLEWTLEDNVHGYLRRSNGMPFFMHRGQRILVAFLGVLVVTEVVLRTVFGFCDTVLLRADPNYEYIAQPDQDRMRFRHHIVYNSLSMRSPEPDSKAVVILGCGDSVINGGVLTGQDSLATTILSTELGQLLGREVQFLNISAGSWGPDNCAAYLNNTKLPQAKTLVLFASSHDAHDNMSFKKVVGVRKSFPDEQYPTAIQELVDRYILPRIIEQTTSTDSELGIDKGERAFNKGFAQLKEYAGSQGIPMVIVLHAERSEIVAGDYNSQGQEIIAFAEENGIHLLRDLDHGVIVDQLRDKIHPNDSGQRKLAEIVMDDMATNKGAYGLETLDR